ncbi:hypothetical protein GCM10027040_25190 [Halomonas shantousis]
MELAATVSLAKDVVLAAAAIAGMSIAIFGINAWHRELEGKNRYDLAKRLLQNTYKYQDAMDNLYREATVLDLEESIFKFFILPYEKRKELGVYSNTKSYEEHREFASIYESRWVEVRRIKSELYSDIVEAKIHFSDSAQELFDKLFSHEIACSLYVNDHIKISYLHSLSDEMLQEAEQRELTVLYEKAKRDIEAFPVEMHKNSLREDVENVVSFLKPKLKRS